MVIQRIKWHDNRTCLCGEKSCKCLPDPRDIELSPGERIVFGRKLSFDGPDHYEEFWIRCGTKTIAAAKSGNRKRKEGLRKLLDILYRKTIHVSGQDDETRLWAVEKLMEVPNLSL